MLKSLKLFSETSFESVRGDLESVDVKGSWRDGEVRGSWVDGGVGVLDLVCWNRWFSLLDLVSGLWLVAARVVVSELLLCRSDGSSA